LYQGIFQGSDNFNSDTKSYNLASGTKGISFDTVGNEGYKIGFSSNSVVAAQPIVIPDGGNTSGAVPAALSLIK
jgi:hypothetical protein